MVALAAKSWLPFTASVLVALSAPGARLVRVWAAPGAAPEPPGATRASWLAAGVRCTVPVAPLAILVTAVLVAKSWLPLMASVLVAEISPAARLMICRSLPAAPTLTTPLATEPAPAKV